MLADRVDFVNGRAAGQQLSRSSCFWASVIGGTGAGVKRGCASGNDADQQIARARFARDFLHSARAFDSALIGNGMAGFLLMNAAQVRRVAVLDVDPSARDAPPEKPFDRAGHGGAGLPCPDHLNAVEFFEGIFSAAGGERPAVEFQMAQHGFLRIGGGQGGAEDLQGVFADLVRDEHLTDFRRAAEQEFMRARWPECVFVGGFDAVIGLRVSRAADSNNSRSFWGSRARGRCDSAATRRSINSKGASSQTADAVIRDQLEIFVVHQGPAAEGDHLRMAGLHGLHALGERRRLRARGTSARPAVSKISLMVEPALLSISSSRSKKFQPSSSARARPTVDLPQPMNPTR